MRLKVEERAETFFCSFNVSFGELKISLDGKPVFAKSNPSLMSISTLWIDGLEPGRHALRVTFQNLKPKAILEEDESLRGS